MQKRLTDAKYISIPVSGLVLTSQRLVTAQFRSGDQEEYLPKLRKTQVFLPDLYKQEKMPLKELKLTL